MAVDDLTERLRRTIADAVPPEEWQKPYPTWHDLMGEAADEIERLRDAVQIVMDELEANYEPGGKSVNGQHDIAPSFDLVWPDECPPRLLGALMQLAEIVGVEPDSGSA